MSYTAKTVVIDVLTNWTRDTTTGFRSFEFYYGGNLIELTPDDFTLYDEGYQRTAGFNTATSKVGTCGNNGWNCSWYMNSLGAGIRAVLVLNSPITFDTIVINNQHTGDGDEGSADNGVKDIKITYSSVEYTDPVFNAFIPNGIEIFEGEIPKHVEADIIDDYYVPLTAKTLNSMTMRSIAFDIGNNWGSDIAVALRAISFAYNGEPYELSSNDYTVYVTSEYNSSDFDKDYIFDTTLSKVGTIIGTSWLSAVQQVTNQRVVVVFNYARDVDTIFINNAHNSGNEGDYNSMGVKELSIYATSDPLTKAEFGADLDTMTEIFDGQIDEHPDEDVPFNYYVPLQIPEVTPEVPVDPVLPTLSYVGVGSSVLWKDTAVTLNANFKSLNEKLEVSNFVGYFESYEELYDLHPTSFSKAYAYITDDLGTILEAYEWEDNNWRYRGLPSGETPETIKNKYESNENTNAFTDNYKSKVDLNTVKRSYPEEDQEKLAGLSNMTSPEIKFAYEQNEDTNAFTDEDKNKLEGIEAGANKYVLPDDVVQDADYIQDKARLENTSGTNTGDQDLSGYETILGSDTKLLAKADLVNGLVPSSQLPGYVDDVIECTVFGATPLNSQWLAESGTVSALTPESDKLYIVISAGEYQNKSYRWSGTQYVEISASLVIGENADNAARGDQGKLSYDHSQSTGNAHNMTKADLALGDVDNTSDVDKPVSTATKELASIPSEADFMTRKESNKLKYLGSGWVEFGKHEADNINEGLYTDLTASNTLMLGGGTLGSSKTSYPVANMGGVEFKVAYINNSVEANKLVFPEAEDGTRSYDSEDGTVVDYLTDVDPKYGDVAGDLNEAVARNFEGLAKNGDFRFGGTNLAATTGSYTVTDSVVNYQVDSVHAMRFSTQTSEVYTENEEFETTIVYRINHTSGRGYLKVALTDSDGSVSGHESVVLPFQASGVIHTAVVRCNSIGSATNNRLLIVDSANTSAGDVDIFSVGIRKITNQPILSRQDLAFLTAGLEVVSDLDIFCPWGNKQFGKNVSPNGTPLVPLTDLGVPSDYFAMYEGDVDTIAYGARWSTMTDEQKSLEIADPWNNLFVSSDDKIEQFRYGAQTDKGNSDSDNDWIEVLKQSVDSENFLPIAVHQVGNKGAYHPTWNIMGCAMFGVSGVGNFLWYNIPDEYAVSDTATCLTPRTTTIGYNGNTGYLTSNLTGRQDQYPYYDIVCNGMIPYDLRLSCRRKESGKLLEDSVRASRVGTKRGRGKNVFSTVYDDAGSGSDANASNLWGVFNGGYYLYVDTPSGKFALDDWVIVNDTTAGTILKFKINNVGVGFISLRWASFDEGVNSNDFELLQGSIVSGDKGTGNEVHYILEKELTQEYNEHPWNDLIADPANLLTTFPNGCIGQWIPVLREVGEQEYPFNKKNNTSQIVRVATNDLGATWSTYGSTIDEVTNSILGNHGTAFVAINSYPALANFTEADDNLSVYGDPDHQILLSSTYDITQGNRLMPSLIGEIGKTDQDFMQGYVNNMAYALDSEGKYTDPSPVYMNPFDLDPSNDTHGMKVVFNLVAKDGLLYNQYHVVEMIYDTTATNWGDDGIVDIVDQETTKTDLNGNTVKVVTHTSQFPVGIAEDA